MSPEPAGSGVSVHPSPAIEARALTLRVGGATLLDRADFTVRRGEIALLRAPSGAGKTVLLKLLAGVLRPGAGTFTADGALRYETTACWPAAAARPRRHPLPRALRRARRARTSSLRDPPPARRPLRPRRGDAAARFARRAGVGGAVSCAT
jgi:energy-coupling factor transporter ATP-binding protein EcfA2